MSGKDCIYWDTNVFLAYINKDRHFPDEVIQGIEELALLVDKHQVDLATSAYTLVEISEALTPKEAYEKFVAFFSHTNVHLIDTTVKIANSASHIRSQIKIQDGNCLGTVDCIHLASSSFFKCKSFYTLDGVNGKKDGILTHSTSLKELLKLEIERPTRKGPPKLPLDL
jgi:predicted nucleic acid-binding protein